LNVVLNPDGTLSGRRAAVIGLGAIGVPIATRLTAAGCEVVGVDRDPARCEHAASQAVTVAALTDALFGRCDVVLLVLPDSPAVASVIRADGFLERLAPSALVVDVGSSNPASTTELAAEVSTHGHELIDAPVSGGVAGAYAGTLTAMVGGTDEQVARARPFLEAFATQINHVGRVGAGHSLKAFNNCLSAISMLATAEAVAALERCGVDTATALDVINHSTGRSYASEIKFPRHVLSGDFGSGFLMRLMVKDLATAADISARLGSPTPILDASRDIWQQALRTHGDDADHTEIARFVQGS
jgi:3-hydroxyisobutyrate dehydrogenase